MNKVTIIIPEQNLEGFGGELVKLTEHLAGIAPDTVSHGFLGGEFGYGAYFENDIFMMHPYCWCEEDDCKWCSEHHEPNFIYKPTNAKVWWYKYIGRSMEAEGTLPANWLDVCISSAAAS